MAARSRKMDEPDKREVALAWIVMDPNLVPERWQGRVKPLAAVPLLPDEASRLLQDGTTSAGVALSEEPFIGMVASGLSPDAIARRTGISLRSVHRRLAALRDDFGVRSTAELVSQLAARGFGNGTNTPVAPTGEGATAANDFYEDQEEKR
jgi:DNA-binding CsgD family transcriptional regulator